MQPYRFKRDNFLFEDVFESKTCQYKMASILKEASQTHANDVRRVERLLPPSLMKTQKIVEDNENNRAQKYPLQGVTRFNQVVIKLQQDAYWHFRVMQ